MCLKKCNRWINEIPGDFIMYTNPAECLAGYKGISAAARRRSTL